MYQEGYSPCGAGGAHVAGVEGRAVGGDDRGVAQGLGTIEAVEPRPQGGNVVNHGVACRGFAAIRARLGTNGGAEHEFGCAVEGKQQNDEQTDEQTEEGVAVRAETHGRSENAVEGKKRECTYT